MMTPARLRASVRPTSLAGKLSFFISSVVVSVVVAGLILFCALAYRIQIKERRDNLQAITATVAKLIARPVSLGDYALVEVYLSDKDMPAFIRALSVLSPDGALLAGHDRTHGRAAAGELTETVTVPIAGAGSTEGGGPSLRVTASFHDIRAEAVAMAGTALGIGFLLVFGIMIVSRLSLRWALGPLKAAVDMGSSTSELDVAVAARAPDEIKPLLLRLSDLYRESSKLEAAGRVGALASQVAHDIRSPLAALDVATRDVSQLPEGSRVLMMGAIDRIRDIANNLLDESRAGLGGRADAEDSPRTAEEPSACLLASLVGPIISEKRLSFRDHDAVIIEAALGAPSYGLFAKVQPGGFKRVLSNLINNSVEALEPSGGLVSVSLSAEADEISVKVSDNGKGIPPHLLAKLGQRGETHGKKGGFGLGLHHAMASVESWGGRLDLRSGVGRGTTVAIILPKAPPPGWFVPELAISPGHTVVILDDEESIHALWRERLGPLGSAGQLRQIHLSTAAALREWVREDPEPAGQALYLLDYELAGQRTDGLSLAAELGIGGRSILVTARSEDPAILEKCRTLGVRVIPKALAGFVPVAVHGRPSTKPDGWDAVLIDDDPLVRRTWEIAARRAGKRLKVYGQARNFLADEGFIARSIPVYIDARLGDGESGERESLRIRALGFSEVYLATGEEPAGLSGLTHLSGVVGKEPPWD